MASAHDAHDPEGGSSSSSTPPRRAELPRAQSGFMVVRPALAAGLGFMDAARADALDMAALTRWFDDHLVAQGIMRPPELVQEPGVGKVSFDVRRNQAWTTAHGARLTRIVATARVRVAVLLGGLLASPPDDRFLNAAIFAGRVQRVAGEHGSEWRACPTENDQLSDIVLSLFAADVLSHREDYVRALCVCDACGLVSLTPDAPSRRRCAQHEG